MPRQALRGVLVGHRATEGFRSDLCFPCWGLLVSADVVNHMDKYREPRALVCGSARV